MSFRVTKRRITSFVRRASEMELAWFLDHLIHLLEERYGEGAP